MARAKNQRSWRPRFSLCSTIIVAMLAASGVGLQCRWSPWFKGEVIEADIYSLSREAGSEVAADPAIWLDFDDGRSVGDLPGDYGFRVFDREGNVLYCYPAVWLVDGYTILDEDTIAFSLIGGESNLRRPSVVYFRRRRPEYWWGLAWLPEFWLSLLFSVGLNLSLLRDRRRLRGRQAAGCVRR